LGGLPPANPNWFLCFAWSLVFSFFSPGNTSSLRVGGPTWNFPSPRFGDLFFFLSFFSSMESVLFFRRVQLEGRAHPPPPFRGREKPPLNPGGSSGLAGDRPTFLFFSGEAGVFCRAALRGTPCGLFPKKRDLPLPPLTLGGREKPKTALGPNKKRGLSPLPFLSPRAFLRGPPERAAPSPPSG